MNDPMTSYERPSLEVVSPLADLTRGVSQGDRLDADFPVGTQRGDLTFS
ncbi:MAG: putative RiPP precursor [Actinomycetota bacterium]|nr:putative RiPP precursor [Actinomycetota bacterium]